MIVHPDFISIDCRCVETAWTKEVKASIRLCKDPTITASDAIGLMLCRYPATEGWRRVSTKQYIDDLGRNVEFETRLERF